MRGFEETGRECYSCGQEIHGGPGEQGGYHVILLVLLNVGTDKKTGKPRHGKKGKQKALDTNGWCDQGLKINNYFMMI